MLGSNRMSWWCVWLVVVAVVVPCCASTVKSPDGPSETHIDVGRWIGHHHILMQEVPKPAEEPKKQVAEIVCPLHCENHGHCNKTTGDCICNLGYHGKNCTQAYQCNFNCSGRGVCVNTQVCMCPPKTGGAYCEQDYRCPLNCSFHGECVNAGTECLCDEGFQGEACQDKVTVFKPRDWNKLFPLPSSRQAGLKPLTRHSHVAAVRGPPNSDELVVWGGVSQAQAVVDMWVYNIVKSRWYQLPARGAAPRPRFNFAGTASSEALYVFGGFLPCASEFSRELWKYSFEDDEWTELPMIVSDESFDTQGPVGRVGHTLTLVGSTLVLAGGSGENGAPLADVWGYDITTSVWTKLASLPKSLRMHGAVCQSTTNHLFLFGGLDADGVAQKSLLAFNGTTWTALGEGPSARFRHTMFWREAALYVFGGQQTDSGTLLADMWLYDTETEKWETVAFDAASEPVAGTAGATITVSANEGVLFGGLTSSDVLRPLHFDFPSRKWSARVTKGNTPQPRMLHSGNVVRNSLWVFGGQNAHENVLSDMWEFDLDSLVWTQYPTTSALVHQGDTNANTYSCNSDGTTQELPWPQRRGGHASVAVEEDVPPLCEDSSPFIVYFGGAGKAAETFNDFWVWCVDTNKFVQLGDPSSTDGLPSKRSKAGLVRSGDTLYVFGGTSADKVRLNDLWACGFDGKCSAVETAGNKHPHKRRSMSFHLDSHLQPHQLLVTGGYWKENSPCASCAGKTNVGHGATDAYIDMWRFETQYNRWRKIYTTDAPQDRALAGTAVHQDKLLMFGGLESHSLFEFQDLWMLNVDYAQWHHIPANGASPPGRHEHTFAKRVIHRRASEQVFLIVFGGIGSSGLLEDVWRVDVTDLVQSFFVNDNIYGAKNVDHTIATNRGTTVRVSAHSSARSYSQ